MSPCGFYLSLSLCHYVGQSTHIIDIQYIPLSIKYSYINTFLPLSYSTFFTLIDLVFSLAPSTWAIEFQINMKFYHLFEEHQWNSLREPCRFQLLCLYKQLLKGVVVEGNTLASTGLLTVGWILCFYWPFTVWCWVFPKWGFSRQPLVLLGKLFRPFHNMRKLTTQQRIKGTTSYNDCLF